MKYQTSTIVINPDHPTTQAGHIQQTYLVDKVNDDLHARILVLVQDITWIHISVDNLGIPLEFNKKLQSALSEYFNTNVHLTISATHSHHCASSKDELYLEELYHKLLNHMKIMELKETDNLQVSYKYEFFDKVGTSRISNSVTKNIFIQLVELYDHDKLVADLITYNTHPTILQAETPFFSADYPGYFLSKLNEKEPDVFHSFTQGAAGDVSTRFNRKSQDYDGVIDLATKLYDKVLELKAKPSTKSELKLSYESIIIPLEHEFTEIDLSNIPDNITDRERQTIEYGQIMRQRLSENPENLTKEVMLSKVSFGEISYIFCPNELFSCYIDEIDVNKTILVCYSNGYSPYVTGYKSHIITYEVFTDTLTDETKLKLIAQLNNWGN